MVPVTVQTLIVSNAPSPSIIVLQPVEDAGSDGKFRVVPIWIGMNEATQLGIALEHARFSRPMTHDLLLDALTNLDARIDHVLINEVKGAMFFSQLTLKQHDRLISLDARPSDSIALAIRQQAPLYIDEEVLNKASFPYVFKSSANEEAEIEEFRSFLEGLVPEDFEG